MKRKVLLVCSIFLVASGLFLLTLIIFSFRSVDKGALQVTSNIKSRVFLNGQQIGETPLCKCEQDDTIPVGDYEIRIEPQDSNFPAFTTRADINGGVLTAVDRTFLPGTLSSSYVLTLEKTTSDKPELIITTIPDGAMVTIDSNPLGATPFKSEAITPAEHEVEIQKQGFTKKTIRLKTINGHKLVVKSQLGSAGGEELNIVSESASATPSASIAPSPISDSSVVKITILKTPNGFLRVRSGAGTNFDEVTRVNSGETYEVITEENGWYKISANGKVGFVSGDFAEKN